MIVFDVENNGIQVSISSTLNARIFHTNVISEAFFKYICRRKYQKSGITGNA